MNRHIWQRFFFENQILNWPCSACSRGRLALQKETLHKGQSALSLNEQREQFSEPEWIEGRFTCLLKCVECSESVAVAGRYSVEQSGDPEYDEEQYQERFDPQFFMQAPHVIHLPKNLPLNIQKEMEKSFQLFWVDLASCANRIRSSVEMLLTDLGVKRTSINRGKRTSLTLHARIEIFEKSNSIMAASLFAIKWIGNAGSHSNLLEQEDVLDGYEILEHVFAEVFDQRSKRLDKITRQINDAKKPRSVKSGSRS